MNEVLQRWTALKAETPTMRARDAAEAIGVSEGALAEARRQTDDVRRLAPSGAEAIQLIEALKGVGRVMTLTRNPSCVHETYGAIEDVKAFGSMGQVVGPIDLRLFFSHWRACYAVAEQARSGLRRSVQVFDDAGDSVIKIYAVDETDMAAWEAMLSAHATEDALGLDFAPRAPAAADQPDEAIDVEALRAGWAALEHSHDFHRLLHETGAGRLQALRLVGAPLATRLSGEAAVELLHAAAGSAVPIMIFVGNPGCVQIFSGRIEKVAPMGPWINVMDPGFHMHLRVDQIASAWRVVKPTRLRGEITSLELFDAEGELIAQAFGARPPGEGENPAWRAIVDGLSPTQP